jgi:hypothetical protein
VFRVWLPPPKYRYKEARNQERCLDADLYPVPNRRGISVSDAVRPVQKTGIEVRDFSLDRPCQSLRLQFEEQTDCHDASDDFIEEKLIQAFVHQVPIDGTRRLHHEPSPRRATNEWF